MIRFDDSKFDFYTRLTVMQPWGGFRRLMLQSQRLTHFQRHVRNPNHFLPSSPVLYSSGSASHIKGQPTSTPAVLPLESRSKFSTSSIFNGHEDSLRPGMSTSSTLQGTTPTQRMPQTTLSGAYEQQAQRETYAFPRDAGWSRITNGRMARNPRGILLEG